MHILGRKVSWRQAPRVPEGGWAAAMEGCRRGGTGVVRVWVVKLSVQPQRTRQCRRNAGIYRCLTREVTAAEGWGLETAEDCTNEFGLR